MIKTINNYTNKSFKNYTGPNDANFKQKNIFFGYNGKGKTALSVGILNEFKKDPSYNENNYRFFNKDYIRDNLLLEDSNELKGVVANFGKGNVDIEKEIAIKKKEIKDLTPLNEKKLKIEQSVKDEIDKIFTSKKGNSSIKKRTGDNISEILEAYNKDLESALKIVSSTEELKNIKDSSETEKELIQLKEISVIDFNYPNEQEINDLNTIMISEYDKNEIPSAKILSWMQEGIEIHKTDKDKKCKFCGGTVHIEEIENKVQKYLSDKKQQDIIKLNKINSTISSMITNSKSINDNKILLSRFLGHNVDEWYGKIEDSIKDLVQVQEKIKSKIESFEAKSDYNNDVVMIIDSIKDNISNINQLKKEIESFLETTISKSNVLIKGAIALEINGNSLITNEMKELDETDNLISLYAKENSKIDAEINELKRKKSTTGDFASFINELLEYLGIDFFLDIKENNYIICHRVDNVTLNLDQISEGENNLLALLLFYYELFNDKLQKDFKDEINLIIVDDPISSVDDINKIYVLEIVKKIITLDKPQVFIFTHVWDDFVNLCYGKQDDDRPGKETPYRFYEIKKNANGSYIKKTKYNETPYMHDFKEIYEFSQLDTVDDLDECEIYHYPNVMRKVLERYMEFKVTNSSPTLDNINNVKIALCENVNKVSHKDELEIPTLLDVCNIMSHKFSRNPEQVLKSAKYLMRKIKDTDGNHFAKMTN